MKTSSIILLFVIVIGINLILIGFSEYNKSKRFNYNHLYSYKKAFGFTKRFIFSGKNIDIPEHERERVINRFERMSKPSSINFNNVKSNKLYHYQLKKTMPRTIKYLESKSFEMHISQIVGTRLYLCNDEKDKVFARSYINESDSIKWHYDNNFSDGKRYTIIIPVYINEKNTSSLQYVNPSDKVVLNVIDKNEDLYMYEGDKIYHRVTEQVNGGKRIVLIIPMYEKKFSLIGNIKMTLKNKIFGLIGL